MLSCCFRGQIFFCNHTIQMQGVKLKKSPLAANNSVYIYLYIPFATSTINLLGLLHPMGNDSHRGESVSLNLPLYLYLSLYIYTHSSPLLSGVLRATWRKIPCTTTVLEVFHHGISIRSTFSAGDPLWLFLVRVQANPRILVFRHGSGGLRVEMSNMVNRKTQTNMRFNDCFFKGHSERIGVGGCSWVYPEATNWYIFLQPKCRPSVPGPPQALK